MGGRIGTRRNTGRIRRPVVWLFRCNVCFLERDFLAVKGRPELGAPEPVHCEQPMETLGLFFRGMRDGRVVYEDAPKLRREWDRLREKLLRGKLCTCGHYRLHHRPVSPYGCTYCTCAAFAEQTGTRIADYSPPGEEVPF